MGSIALPALDIKAPQQEDLLQKFAQLNQIKASQQAQAQNAAEAPLRMQALNQGVQSGQMDLQQKQQEQQDSQAFRAASQDPSFQGKTIGQIADALAASGHISQAGLIAAKKADLDHQKSIADLDTTKLDNAKKSHDQLQQLCNNIMDLPDDQVAAQWPTIAQQVNSIPGGDKVQLNPNQPLTKQQLASFAPMLSLGNAYLDQELARRKAMTEQKQLEGKTDPNSPLYAPTKEAVAMGAAPGAEQIKAGEVKQEAAKAEAIAKARLPYEMRLAAQRQALSQGNPDDAAKLLVNGDATLSELKARGATPSFISRTLSTANRLSGGKYNAQQAEAEFKVAGSPTNLAFFGSAKSLTDPGGTLDQLAEAGKSIPSNQLKALNTLEDWEKEQTSNGPLAHYASTALGVADDYAKVMGGGQGTDTSRLQALNLIKANAGPEARAGALQGIRGAVDSQVNSRIGNNSVMKRMYGSSAKSAPAPARPAGVPANAVWNPQGHNGSGSWQLPK